MTWSLSYSPLVPVPLIVAAAIIAALLATFILYRRQRGALLRILALTLLVFALLDPAIQRENREPLTSVAAIVVDRSQSQSFADRDTDLRCPKNGFGRTHRQTAQCRIARCRGRPGPRWIG